MPARKNRADKHKPLIVYENGVGADFGSAPLTVKDLRDVLDRCNVPDDAVLMQYSDAEGNAYKRTWAVSFHTDAEDYSGNTIAAVLEFSPAH